MQHIKKERYFPSCRKYLSEHLVPPAGLLGWLKIELFAYLAPIKIMNRLHKRSGPTAARKQLLRPNDSTQTEAAAQSDSLRKSQIQVFDSQSFIVFIVGILHTFGAILIEIN